MTKRAILVLEDGSVYEGYSFGAEAGAYGEVVFNTSMTAMGWCRYPLFSERQKRVYH